jgi:hypothetical protein
MDLPQNATVCSPSREQDVKKRLTNYIKKQPNELFILGQKYYVVDKNVPNCINSFVCGESFRKGQTSRRFNEKTNQLESFQVDKDKCFSSDAQYNTGNEKLQLSQLDKTKLWDDKGVFNKYETKIWDTKKYPYELNNDNPNVEIYYRNCPIYGCKSGTSALDISMGGKRKQKKTKRKQKLKKNRKTRK